MEEGFYQGGLQETQNYDNKEKSIESGINRGRKEKEQTSERERYTVKDNRLCKNLRGILKFLRELNFFLGVDKNLLLRRVRQNH